MATYRQNNVFLIPIPISKKLANFIGYEYPAMISRSECAKKITEYIKINNLGTCETRATGEHNFSIINPDEGLSNLFDFPEYQKNIHLGKIVWNRKIYGEETKVVETDDRLTYTKMHYMLSMHYQSDKLKNLNAKLTSMGMEPLDVYPYPLQEEEILNTYDYSENGEKFKEAQKNISLILNNSLISN